MGAIPVTSDSHCLSLPEPPRTITTARLLLRPLQAMDVEAVFAYQSDPAFRRYTTGLPEPYEREDAERYVARFIAADWREHPYWAVEFEAKLVGGVWLPLQPEHRRAEIGWHSAPWAQGRGFATEAGRALLVVAFDTLGLRRVWAVANAENAASIRVMQKLGIRPEGVLRRSRIVHGKPIDQFWAGILREEWEARRRT